MRRALCLSGLAAVLVVVPARAADLKIPPPLPSATKASFRPPPSRAVAPLPAPVELVVPNVPDEAPVQQPAAAPPPPVDAEPHPADDAPMPTLLDRFGPFLKSQLELIFTGSIPKNSETRCAVAGTAKKRANHRNEACGQPSRPRRARAAKNHLPRPQPAAQWPAVAIP